MQKMSRFTLCLVLGVFAWGFASCVIVCPDARICDDSATCCFTPVGYGCCPLPNAVCCSDMAHCCPSGFRCNAATKQCLRENMPWMSVPMRETYGSVSVP